MKKIKKLLIITLLTISGGLIISAASTEWQYSQKIFPGVQVGNIVIGGLRKEAALNKLESGFNEIQSIKVISGNNNWEIPIADLGLNYNSQQSVDEAYSVGRTGGWINKWKDRYQSAKYGWRIEPEYTVDEEKLNQAIQNIAKQIDIPAMEPEIVLDPNTKAVSVSSGENGQKTDERLLQQKIKLTIKNLDRSPVEIPVRLLRPKLSDAQLTVVRNKAMILVEKAINIELAGEPEKWSINDETMLRWIDPQTTNWKVDDIKKWVEELAGSIDKPAQNASFRFVNGKVQEFKPARNGVIVDRQKTAEAIIKTLKLAEEGNANLDLAVETQEIPPEIQTGEVNDLGLKELIGKGESWFSGSIDNRIFNLKKAAEALNGVLIAPGETFSFNNAVGEISASTGYKPAYIIKNGQTILGDGGGVCQVSSTLFRAILYSGLPIEERVAHAYRVSYYEENYQPGFDATVFQPSPDFKFKNDTPGHILIQTVYDEQKKYLSFELYGTSDGRKVEVSKARMWDVTAPPPDLYKDDPNMLAGKVVQVEHAAWGAKVAFDWKVTRGDEVLQQRTFYSNFQPWQAVYLRGTKI